MESVKFAAPVDTTEEWKKKKNYKPAALFTVLLLGTAFLAGSSYATYGSNASVPTGSLSATSDISNWGGAKTGSCPHVSETGGAPTKCPGDQEFWHVAGITDDQLCLPSKDRSVQICGDLCVSPLNTFLLDMFVPAKAGEDGSKHAPNSHGERPRKGNCASAGYTHDTGFNIAPLAMLPNFAAYIHTK